MAEAGIPRSEVSVTSSELHDIRGAFDLMPTEGEEAHANIDARLAAVPAALAGFRLTLLESADKGRVSAKRQYHEIAGQIRRWTGQEGTGGDVFKKLVDSLDAEGALADSLARHAAGASAAFAEFGRFLDDELGPRGRDREAVGRDEYALCSRYFLGATVDLDETYAWGWAELKRLHDEMVETADRIVPGGSVDEAVAALDADPAPLDRGSRAVPRLDAGARRPHASPRWPTSTSTSPSRSARSSAGSPRPTTAASTTHRPSEDFSRPGRMWWSVPDGIDTLLHLAGDHDGLPRGRAGPPPAVRADDLPRRAAQPLAAPDVLGQRPRRGLGALLRAADGRPRLPRRPRRQDGHARQPAFRAARVIVDIGMHLELEIPKDNPFGFHPGETWTPALGLEFMRQHCRMEDEYIQYEVLRYLGWPGQAPAYKVGERMWLECRDEVKARRGADFDLKQFHTEALNLGSPGPRPVPGGDGPPVTVRSSWARRRRHAWRRCARRASSPSSSCPGSTSRR